LSVTSSKMPPTSKSTRPLPQNWQSWPLEARVKMLMHLQRVNTETQTAPTSLIAWATTHLRHRLTTYDPTSPTLGLSRFHVDLANTCDALVNTRGQRQSWEAPRGFAKSSWALSHVLREALEGREPYTVLVGDTQTGARGKLDILKRELESNRSLIAAYPNAAGTGPVWNQDIIRLKNGTEIEAVSTGAAIRGRLKSTRPRLIVPDDIQGKDDIISPILRQRAWDWFMQDLLPMGEPETNVLVIGTAIHRDSVVCKLRSTPGWRSHLYSAIENPPSDPVLWDAWERILHGGGEDAADRARAFYNERRAAMDVGAILLWPERFPLHDLMMKMVEGPPAFASEYQNNPTNPELNEWPEEYFDDKSRPEFWFDEWPSNLVIRAMALDPSKGRRDKLGDYSAFVLFGATADGMEYVEADLFRGSQDATTDGIIRRCVNHVREFKPEVLGVEAVGFQSLYGRILQQAIDDAGLEVHIHPNQDNTDKGVRIRRLTTPLAKRRIRFRRTKGTMLLVDQLRDFGPASDKVDGPDCLEQCRRVAWLWKQGKIRTRGGNAGPAGYTT